MSKTNNNHRIVKNTLFLYFRMVLTLVVTLYTSRVVLNSLGVEDFGIYNVVGGVVTMMAFLSGAMSSATQRFLAFELGKNDSEQLHNVFRMSLNIHLLIIFFVVLVAETLGVWFLNTQLVIPVERLAAANLVFHCALFSFCCAILGVPYNAAIIAHEKMSAFAYVSIVDVLLKLAVVFLLAAHGGDKLQFYAFLLALVSVVTFGCYYAYARWQFAAARFSWYWNTDLFKTLFSYTGWNLFGNLAAVATNQGINILLNLFFGAAVNTARAIAFQVNGAITGFVNSLQMSINPQIIKAYAANDSLYMHELIFSGAKYTFYLMFVLALPLFIESEAILSLWLGSVPQYTNQFVRLVLIDSCIICFSGTLMTSAQATGRISLYQTVVGGFQLCNLPISLYLLRAGSEPLSVYYVSIVISLLSLFLRLLFLKWLIKLSIHYFLKKVMFPAASVTSLSIFFVYTTDCFFSLFKSSFIGAGGWVINSIFSFIVTFSFIYFVGLNKAEKNYLKSKFNIFTANKCR